MDNKNWLLGTDLELAETPMGADISNTAMGDLKEISEELNLAQAILHRLRTIRGELSDIGHPDYGSNLYDLIGEPNNQTTRDRLKTIVRSAIKEEPRIKEIVKIEVKSRLAILETMGPAADFTIKQSLSRVELRHQDSSMDVPEGRSYAEDRRMLATSVDVDITVIPIDSNVPLNILFPFNLEGA